MSIQGFKNWCFDVSHEFCETLWFLEAEDWPNIGSIGLCRRKPLLISLAWKNQRLPTVRKSLPVTRHQRQVVKRKKRLVSKLGTWWNNFQKCRIRMENLDSSRCFFEVAATPVAPTPAEPERFGDFTWKFGFALGFVGRETPMVAAGEDRRGGGASRGRAFAVRACCWWGSRRSSGRGLDFSSFDCFCFRYSMLKGSVDFFVNECTVTQLGQDEQKIQNLREKITEVETRERQLYEEVTRLAPWTNINISILYIHHPFLKIVYAMNILYTSISHSFITSCELIRGAEHGAAPRRHRGHLSGVCRGCARPRSGSHAARCGIRHLGIPTYCCGSWFPVVICRYEKIEKKQELNVFAVKIRTTSIINHWMAVMAGPKTL